jgi:hypothetical protein
MMSENEKPENLLAEILYSRKRVHASYYEDGKFTGADDHGAIDGDLTSDYVKTMVLDALGRLLNHHTCGIVIEPSHHKHDDTVLRVYELPTASDSHLWHVPKPQQRWLLPSQCIKNWQFKFFQTVPVAYTASLEEACTGAISRPWSKYIVSTPEGLRAVGWEAFNISVVPAYVGDKAPLVADVAAAELTPSLPDIQTRISALKGAFALATGQYDDVTEADIQAAVAAGSANPEVLRGVKDATWLMVEAHRDAAWSKGFDKGYEAKAATLDYVEVPEGNTVVQTSDAVTPPTENPVDDYKATTRALTLRRHRAETILAELQALQAFEDSDLLQESVRTWA